MAVTKIDTKTLLRLTDLLSGHPRGTCRDTLAEILLTHVQRENDSLAAYNPTNAQVWDEVLDSELLDLEVRFVADFDNVVEKYQKYQIQRIKDEYRKERESRDVKLDQTVTCDPSSEEVKSAEALLRQIVERLLYSAEQERREVEAKLHRDHDEETLTKLTTRLELLDAEIQMYKDELED